jgi:hypothetical protein
MEKQTAIEGSNSMKVVPLINGEGSRQQTMAAQLVIAGRQPARSRRRSTPRAPSRKAARARPVRAAARRTTKRPARLVKGSAAAKRYMAIIRGGRSGFGRPNWRAARRCRQ